MKSLNTLFKVLFVILVASTTSFAQTTLTVGSATGVPGTNGASPISVYYQSMHYQTIYTATELAAAGFTAGMAITELAWDVTEVPSEAGTPVSLPNYTIKMGHTANQTSTTANTIDASTLQQVYNNPSYFPTVGYDVLTFQTPFGWNGVDNIVIDACFDDTGDWEDKGRVSIYTATPAAHYFRADGVNQCGATTGNIGNDPHKPVVQFTTVPGPSCISVNNVMAMNITDVSADISFGASGSPVSYILEYGIPNLAPGTGTVVTSTTSPIPLSGLSPATDYGAIIWAVCGTSPGDTSLQTATTFSTTCSPSYTAPYTEQFEGASVACLTSSAGALTSGGGWQNPGWAIVSNSNYGASSPLEGSNYLLFNTEGTALNDTVFLLPVDVSALTTPFLDFAYHLNNPFANTTVGSVDVQIDSAGTWLSIFSRSTPQGDSWKFASIDLTNYTAGGTANIRFVGSTPQAYIGGPGIDRLRIKDAPVTACAIQMAPDTLGFEDAGVLNACWEQPTNDIFDWTINDPAGPPHSPNTGPSGPNSGTYYAFIESSSPRVGGDSAILVSPPYNVSGLTDAPAVYFMYHMYGNDSARLRLEYEIFGTDLWIPVWESFGDSHNAATDPFTEAYVPLPDAVGSTVRLRFVGVTGHEFPGNNVWQSDIAIDDLRIQNVLANDVGVTNITTPGNDCGLGVESITVEVINRGFNSQSNIPVFVSINGGGSVGAYVTGPIEGNGGMGTVDVLINMSALGSYDITANTTLMNDEVPSNDAMSASAYSQSNHAGEYDMPFEMNDGYWYGDGSWEHGAPTAPIINGAAAGSNAFVTNLSGNYAENDISYLYSPCFDLSGLATPLLRFSIFWDTEDNTDGAWLEYNAGLGWAKLGVNDLSGQSWYNDTITNGNVGWAWTGTNANSSQGWLDAIIDLSSYGVTTSTNTKFRFAFMSDDATNNEGIGVDNFGIFDGCIDPTLNETVADESIPNAADGSITLNPVAGVGGYSYLWYDGSTSNSVSGLAPGTYDVTVTDGNSCMVTASFTIGTACPTDLGLSTVNNPTIGDGTTDGSAQVTATSGMAPYTYNWSNGSTTDENFSLGAGDYTVVVTDANGCTDTTTITISTVYLDATENIEGLTGLLLSPNPAKDFAQLNITFDRTVDLTVRIADVTGRILETRNAGNTSATEMRFDLANFAEGVYFMQFIADGQVATRKFVVVK